MQKETRTNRRAFLIGGGIASLAAALFLIRDGGMAGQDITIFEQTGGLGGSLDGFGSPEMGYVVRGGRMLDSKYVCTYDLFSSIPAIGTNGTVTEQIFAWNKDHPTFSHARLVRGKQAIDAPPFGLNETHVRALERLMFAPEQVLGSSSVEAHFAEDFFATDFWLLWSTTFSFQRWHSAIELKRHLVRFIHLVPGFNRLEGVLRTFYNQFDSMVRPLHQWLRDQGVQFRFETSIQDMALQKEDGEGLVTELRYASGRMTGEIAVHPGDLVLLTLGSITETSAFGDNDKAAPFDKSLGDGAWSLWKHLATKYPEFGRPDAFLDHIDQSKWISSTTTLSDPAFFRFMRDFTGNLPGEGGLVTLADSPWLLSLVLPHQPYFLGQPEDVEVFWSYGLQGNRPGTFIRKTMEQCSGLEILTEILGHLGVTGPDQQTILDASITIPCMMPYITSQFSCRKSTDRPAILPEGWKNLAFLGQFCEQPDDAVFTVEYSVRSAAKAVYGLLALDRHPPDAYNGLEDAKALSNAWSALRGA